MIKIDPNRVNEKDHIGRGSFADVCGYLNKDGTKSENWAIKVIRLKSTTDLADIFDVVQKIVLGFSCDHPNVLPIKGYCFDLNEDEMSGKIYLKIPRMKKSLEFARKKPTFSEEEIIKIFYQLVSGLNYLHQRKIAHRDIKPENVLIDAANQVKLSDIGIGNYVEESTRTVNNPYSGTRLYMAPELSQVSQEGNVDPPKLKNKQLFKTDMWSLGLMMAELCVPLNAKNMKSLILLKAEEKEKYLSEQLMRLEGKFSHSLLKLILNLLKVNPEERTSAADLKQTLEVTFPDILAKIDLVENEKGTGKAIFIKEKTLAFKNNLDSDLLGVIQELLRSDMKESISLEDLKKRLESGYQERLDQRIVMRTDIPCESESSQLDKYEIEIRKSIEELTERMTEIQQFRSGSFKQEIKEIKPLYNEECMNKLPKKVQEAASNLKENFEKTSSVSKPETLEKSTGELEEEKKTEEPKRPVADSDILSTKEEKIIPNKTNDEKEAIEEDYGEIIKELEKMNKKFKFQTPGKPVRLMIEPKDPSKITDNDLTELISSLKNYQEGEALRKLKGIAISLRYCNRVSAQIIKQIGSELGKNCQNLLFLELDFLGCEAVVNDEVLKFLSDELKTNLTNLQTLHLFFNECSNITGNGVEKISFFPHLVNLKVLKINFESCQKISNDSVKLLIQRIGKNLANLRTLELYLNDCDNIDDDTVQEMAAQLINLKNLTCLKLVLSYCKKINNDALVELAQKIGENLSNLNDFELALHGLSISPVSGTIRNLLKRVNKVEIHVDP